MRFQCRSMAINLLAVIAMKLINQFTTFLFSIYNSDRFYYANGTCLLRSPEELVDLKENPVMNVIHTGYLFSVAGGLLANKWLGFRTVLIIGGVLMSVGIGLMCISIWFGLICQLGFYILVWLFHPVYMGLMLPCLLYGFVRWSTGPVSRMVLVVLYYYAADEAWLEFLEPLVKSHVQQGSLGIVTLIGLVLSLTFAALSALQRQDELHHKFEQPTATRLNRYCKILIIFTLFTIQIDGHASQYQQEILDYSNSSNFTQGEQNLLHIIESVNIPRLIYMAGFLGTTVTLIVVGAVCQRYRRFLLPEQRIQIGIGIAAVVAATCFIANVVLLIRGPTSPILTTAIFGTAALFDGVGEVLAMVAIYEYTLKICSESHRLLMVGIALSIWSLAYLMRLLLHHATLIILKSVTTTLKHDVSCAYHALNFLLLVACLFCTHLVSFPMAFTLIQEQERWERSDEREPLLYVS